MTYDEFEKLARVVFRALVFIVVALLVDTGVWVWMWVKVMTSPEPLSWSAAINITGFALLHVLMILSVIAAAPAARTLVRHDLPTKPGGGDGD